jgi:hypothetical protein
VPASAANLDHLVSDGASLWVIDTKVWRGDIVRLGDRQLWYADAPVVDRLSSLGFLVDAVQRVLLGQPTLAELVVRPLVCIHGARLPESPAVEADVTLTSPGELVPYLARVGGGHGRKVRDELERVFPPRTRQHVDTYASIPHTRERNTTAPMQGPLPLQWP